MSSLSFDEAARTLAALLKSQANKEPPLYLNQVEMRELQWLSDRPAGSLLHIREPRVVIERPEAKLFIPRDVWLWVAKSCRTELRPWDAEPYEDYRVRLAEEAALGVYRRSHSPVADRLRRSRGKALALDLRIQHIGFGIWYVPSSGAGTEPRLPITIGAGRSASTSMRSSICKRRRLHRNVDTPGWAHGLAASAARDPTS
jgi:hypothetical protein